MRLSTPMSDYRMPAGGTTPFPNFLLDKVMPRLRDTEWRVLTVVVRQTFGWSLQDGKRKQSDWLSHFQLKRRTGRSGAALSRAIDVLVRCGLVVVRDSFGCSLESAAQRRRSHSHLSFSIQPLLGSLAFQERFAHARFWNSKTRNDKRNLDKRKQQHRSNKPAQGERRHKPDAHGE
jgi:hypothetical protein